MLEQTNRLGAVVALLFYSSAILVFVFRLLGYPQADRWIGYGELLLVIPLLYLLVQAPPSIMIRVHRIPFAPRNWLIFLFTFALRPKIRMINRAKLAI